MELESDVDRDKKINKKITNQQNTQPIQNKEPIPQPTQNVQLVQNSQPAQRPIQNTQQPVQQVTPTSQPVQNTATPQPVQNRPTQQPIQPAYQPPTQPVQAPMSPVTIQYRNPILWVILSLVIPFGIFYWLYKTGEEIKSKGGQIPHILIVLVPLVGSLYYFYKYSQEFARCINGSEEWIMTFLSFFIAPIGIYLVQTELNKLSLGKPQSTVQPTQNVQPMQQPTAQPEQAQKFVKIPFRTKSHFLVFTPSSS